MTDMPTDREKLIEEALPVYWQAVEDGLPDRETIGLILSVAEAATPAWLELRPDQRGEFDELVARGVDTVHFEMMGDNRLCIELRRDKKSAQVLISARGKLTVTTEEA